jgi:ATP-dependent Clp protease, protease subunit
MNAAPRFLSAMMRAPSVDVSISGIIEGGEAEALREVLEQSGGAPVVLRINSPGGIASEGSAMSAEVWRHGNVVAYGQGIVASAATLVFCAAKRAVLHRDCLFMIHDPAAMVFGAAENMRKAAEDLDKMADVYAAAYARRTGIPVATIRRWMIAETWMTAEEAVGLKFADEIEKKAQGEPVARADYTAFRNAPEGLRQLTMQSGWTGQPDQKGTDDVEG